MSSDTADRRCGHPPNSMLQLILDAIKEQHKEHQLALKEQQLALKELEGRIVKLTSDVKSQQEETRIFREETRTFQENSERKVNELNWNQRQTRVGVYDGNRKLTAFNVTLEELATTLGLIKDSILLVKDEQLGNHNYVEGEMDYLVRQVKVLKQNQRNHFKLSDNMYDLVQDVSDGGVGSNLCIKKDHTEQLLGYSERTEETVDYMSDDLVDVLNRAKKILRVVSMQHKADKTTNVPEGSDEEEQEADGTTEVSHVSDGEDILITTPTDDEYDEILSNEILNHDEVHKFKGIIGHEGPLTKKNPSWKGSSYNVQVEWENGEITAEPLATIGADDPVTCAIYARENDLLEVLGWKRFKGFAK